MEFPKQIKSNRNIRRISSGQRSAFHNYAVSLSLGIVFTLTNDVEPDEMPHDPACCRIMRDFIWVSTPVKVPVKGFLIHKRVKPFLAIHDS